MGVGTRNLIKDRFDDERVSRHVGWQTNVCGDGSRSSIEGSMIEVWIVGLWEC